MAKTDDTLFLLFSGIALGAVGYFAYKQRAPTFAYYGNSEYSHDYSLPISVSEQPSEYYSEFVSESSIYPDTVENTPQAVATESDNFIVRFFGNMKMSDVDPLLLYNPNISAFLRMIRVGEGTADDGGYNRLFGGGTFDSFSWHPNIKVSKSGYTSTAAGAYQFLYSTWNDTAKAMGLNDFSPASQDLGALGRLAYRGAINDILAGNFTRALQKTSKEWASLPYSPYGQPTISLSRAKTLYASYGGTINA
jgi:lysozyme